MRKRPPIASDAKRDDYPNELRDVNLLATPSEFHKYLSLPSADELRLAAHHGPLRDDEQAVDRINQSRAEAWDLRVELARTWKNPILGQILALLTTKFRKIPDEARRIHPDLGPVLEVIYEERLPAHLDATKVDRARLQQEIEECATVRNQEAQSLKEKHSHGAKTATRLRENRKMVKFVRSYTQWLRKSGKRLSMDSRDEFPVQKGMIDRKGRDLLGTLINAILNKSERGSVLELLQKNGFNHATSEEVDESMRILEEVEKYPNV